MSAASGAERAGRWRQRRDLVTVILLSLTAVLTAWCGFQASKWSGEMSISFSQASSARVQAADAASQARDARQWDLTLWVQWVLADGRNDQTLRDYVEKRFSPELRTAFEQWQANGKTDNGPFATKAYSPEGAGRAEELNHRADVRFARALETNQLSDNYTLLTVLFALVLFLTALSQRDLKDWGRTALLTTALVGAAAGIVLLAIFPINI
ncbi:hypothetical protein SAMN05660766_0584 [Curtobacterium sp. 314Chir4.1]|uniref:hypothetical protein n=1 Tax=Curtobacterium sp. 314Chir4.1 TaxID=1279028 RepID=UPI000BDD5415|nr:hypothetical protein [Curtobacterium sp. 314Chir4.1]SOC86920.1 hypothetical protein SAMN05660766_0584 [Curtobacterium sp. 314Chir4.1]